METIEATTALDGCPFCEGGGVVPTASGMSDQPCLCTTVAGTRRLIAAGRLGYAARCSRDLPLILARGDDAQAAVYLELARAKQQQAAHLIYGCGYGACTGNSDRGQCLAPGAFDQGR